MVLIIKIREKFILLALLLSICFSMCGFTPAAPALSAKAAVVVHEGRLLYGKNEKVRLPMASTTKLMTAIVALENAEIDETVKIKSEYCGIEGSSMYLRPGTEKTVLDLLKGLLLVSGNDAATALASHVSGSAEDFVRLMNKKARELGMEDTNFVNPHGLSHKSHYSTAYDMAILMEYCMENPLFRELISLKSFDCDGAQLLNHNKLLFVCEGCIGGKTGYTMDSGRCLVSCCEREGARTVCVTLSAPDDWNDHMALYNWCYANHSLRSVTESVSFSVPLINNAGESIELLPENSVEIFLKDDSEVELQARLPWFVFEPISAGEKAGLVSIYVDGESLGEYYLIYSKDHF